MQRGVGAVAGIVEGGGGNCAIMMQNYHHRHRRRRRHHHQQQQAPLFSASLYAPSLSLLSPSIPRRQLTTLLSGTSTSSSFKFFDNSSCRLQFGGMFSWISNFIFWGGRFSVLCVFGTGQRGVWNLFFPSEFCFSSYEEGRGVMMTTTMMMQEMGCGNW